MKAKKLFQTGKGMFAYRANIYYQMGVEVVYFNKYSELEGLVRRVSSNPLESIVINVPATIEGDES